MQTTYQLLRKRGSDAYKANKLMSGKIRTLEQHLDYEAIIQIAEIDDQDLLYLNFDNQALGELLLTEPGVLYNGVLAGTTAGTQFKPCTCFTVSVVSC